jgi:hypothetical protein
MRGKCMNIWALLLLLSAVSFGCSKDSGTSVDDETTETDSSGDTDDNDGTSNKGVSHETDADYVWDASSEIVIELNGTSITCNSSLVTIASNVATITAAGNYRITGTLTNGQVVVNTTDSLTVRLILSGADITSSTSSPLYIEDAKKVVVVLPDNTSNKLTDASTYTYATTEITEPSAALYSKSDLTIFGNGSLNITGNYNDGISSKDGLVVKSGQLTVTAKDDAIRGKDYVIVKGGTITATAQGNGLKSDNESDATAGYVSVEGGSTTIVSKGDGLQAKTDVTVSAGTLKITAGDAANTTTVAKGIKSGGAVTLSGGTVNVTVLGNLVLTAESSGYDPSYCIGVKSETAINVSGADVTIVNATAGGKGLSADTNINVTGGSLNITTSGKGATYKNTSGTTDAYSASSITADGNIVITNGQITTVSSGVGGKAITANGTITIGDTGNSPVISLTTLGAKFTVSGSDYCHPKAIKSEGDLTINNGTIAISSTDDALCSTTQIIINNGTVDISKSVEGIESKYITVNGGYVSIDASDDGINATFSTVSGGTESNDGSCFTLNGGTLVASTTKGDAVDSNGNIVVTGGSLIVHGPPSQPEEAVDFNGTFKTTGGFVIAAGINSNMVKAMSSSSTQLNLFATSSTSVSAGTIFRVQDADGNDLVTFKPERAGNAFIFSSPSLAKNTTYYIYTGGTCTGTLKDGLYTGGTYSGGTQKKSFTLSSTVTSLTF